MKQHRHWLIFAAAAAIYLAVSLIPWTANENIRRAAAVVLVTLVLWISEIAPLGVIAMAIPIIATFTGLMPWREAVAAWGDPVVFLFLGAFLLARALDKHGAFEWVMRVRWAGKDHIGSGVGFAFVVLLVSGIISSVQNNTAVTAMMLPVVAALARKTRVPYAVVLALAWGATFGGMATPVGTAPNFIGYAAMKKIDPSVNFILWLRVGLPVWLGLTIIGWATLAVSARWSMARRRTSDALKAQKNLLHSQTPPRPSPCQGEGAVALTARSEKADAINAGPEWIEPFVETDVGPARADEKAGYSARDRRIVLAAFACAVLLWLVPGAVITWYGPKTPPVLWVEQYLPESLVPIAVAWVLFLITSSADRSERTPPRPSPSRGEGDVKRSPRAKLLDRHDFQALDWDTLFLIAGGLSLGKMLESSGAAAALASTVAGSHLSPMVLMFALAGATVLLSELTSNTATASLLVPLAGSLAGALGVSPVEAIWLVTLSASMGFALPVSTPPNALVYGTRLVPLRTMAATGIAVDVIGTVWVVCCVRWWA